MESAFVNVDRFGRVVLPKKLRGDAETFEVVKIDEELRLRPVPTLDEMFGSMKNIDLKKFAAQHEEDSRE